MNVVVDASFAGAWLLPDEASTRADRLLRRVLSGEATAHVPGLWNYEMTNLLVTAERRRRLDGSGFDEALSLVNLIPRQVHPQEAADSRKRIGLLAQRFRLSAYDAAYLELADQLQCGLATLDESLGSAVREMSLPIL